MTKYRIRCKKFRYGEVVDIPDDAKAVTLNIIHNDYVEVGWLEKVNK